MDTTLTPKVSILLPVYNTELYIKEAIQGVLAQTFTNYEFLIIDDGSTDTSQELIQSFNDKRIIFIKHEKNQGLIATLNEGVMRAKGVYVARIDADDIWTSIQKLEKQVMYLDNHPECVVVGTWANTINETGQITGTIRNPIHDNSIRQLLLIKNYLIHPSTLFRKESCVKAGVFHSDEKYVEDYGLWLRMGMLGTFANIPEYLMSYRIHKKSITQSKNKEQIKNAFDLIMKHKQDYPNILLATLKWKLKLLLSK